MKTPTKKIPFSRLGSVQPVINYFEKRGLPVQKYLRQAGISDMLLADLETPVPKKIQWDFVAAACDGEGINIDEIGVLVGIDTSLEELGEFGQFLLGSGTIGNYLVNGCRFINLMSTGEYYWLFEEVDQLRFCVSVSGLQENHAVHNNLYILLTTINTIRQAAGETWCPTEVTVPAMKAGTAAKLAEFLPRTKISRCGHYSSFLIPYAFLEKSLISRSNLPVSLKDELPQDFKRAVKDVIKIQIFARRPGLEYAAELSSMSSRTFQRKLKEMGLSYTELVVEERIDIAKQWLDNGDLSITDISQALGYRNMSNFGRAFRRLVGQSPSAFQGRIDRSASPATQIEKLRSQSK